jgi:3-deoxy-D-manno-octulosonic-acid transferase
LRYRLLSILLLPLWLLHALWQAIQHRELNYLWQRLGLFPVIGEPCLWVHASSVGEVELVKPLIQALAAERPVILTTFTATGYRHARRIMPPQVLVRVLPIDFQLISRAFMRRHAFRLGLIAETELWPETLYQARRQGCELLQINARLSAKTLNAPNWIRGVLQRTLGYFSSNLTRSEQDRERLLSMGISSERITICGNLKQATQANEQDYPDLVGRPYLLFASTHAPEEQLFGEMMQRIDSSLLTVIAPRHPQRAGEILKSLKSLELPISQRSQHQPVTEQTGIYLADTLGELKALIAHAQLVVMGGSFNRSGGHNLLEAARLGKAVITGPSDDNIRQDIDWLQQHQAVIQVDDINQLERELDRLLKDRHQCDLLGTNALQAVRTREHVLQDYLDQISTYLPSAS